MEIVEQTIISVEIDGKRIEFPDKASAAETVNVLKAVGKFLQEGQQVPAARALKKYFESTTKEAAEASKPRKPARAKKKAAAAAPPAAQVTEKQPADNNTLGDTDKSETEKPEKATRNILPNPPGFTRPVDPKTSKPQRGRAPNAEKIAWAEQHAGDPEVQAWAKENEVTIPDAKTPISKPTPPAPPTSEAKLPAPPVEGFGPPPVGPPPAL